MTDLVHEGIALVDIHTSDAAKRRLAKRYASERGFKYLGLGAVLVAVVFLVILLSTIVLQAIPAFTFHYLTLPMDLTAERVDPKGNRDPRDISRTDFEAIVRDGIRGTLDFVSGRSDRRELGRLLSSSAGIDLREQVLENPAMIGGIQNLRVQFDDYADLYLKGRVTGKSTAIGGAAVTVDTVEMTATIAAETAIFAPLLAELKAELRRDAKERRADATARERSVKAAMADRDRLVAALRSAPEADRGRLESERVEREALIESQTAQIARLNTEADALEARGDDRLGAEPTQDALASVFIEIGGGVVKAGKIGPDQIVGEILVPLETIGVVSAGSWRTTRLLVPQSSRKLGDKSIAWIDLMKERGLVEKRLNNPFFSRGASREPELAGVWGAVVGSFWTMLVTLLLSFPLGVAAAVYLEEFAPKNRLTQLIEVNINNLAAVPSIVFGLLGLAMFLNVFGLPRSAPLVGGMVLALMTLPTVIIASRAALRAVPPSIREAALGMGASKLQTVFHHVLPLAMPGILTGTIIGMAQALGETAPLLMIGMVAFIVDIPSGPLSAATVLPVQIYMWADFPEPAFQQKTGAAILILLTFLIAMNAIAVILRKRFERRW